jgi:hypothetical protein
VGIGRWGEVESGWGERRGAVIFVSGGEEISFGESGIGALDFSIGIGEDGEDFDDFAEGGGFGGEGEAEPVGFARGGRGVEFFDGLEIEASGEGGDGIVEELALAEGIEFDLFEGGVIDPEFFAVADGDAGGGAFDFAAEFVGDLESDGALGGEWGGEEMGGFLFGKIGEERGKFGAVILEGFEEGEGFGGGKFGGGEVGSGEEEREEKENEAVHCEKGEVDRGEGKKGRKIKWLGEWKWARRDDIGTTVRGIFG